jgi:hypothetical protein
VIFHAERVGDQVMPGSEWIGKIGEKRRIEAFGVRALEILQPEDIQYKSRTLAGRETRWVNGPNLCGSRGRSMPLTGFAIRVPPHLQARFDVEYRGAFFGGGIVGPLRNGELCASKLDNDPLEALSVRITERVT